MPVHRNSEHEPPAFLSILAPTVLQEINSLNFNIPYSKMEFVMEQVPASSAWSAKQKSSQEYRKIMKKKLLPIILTILCLSGLTACGDADDKDSSGAASSGIDSSNTESAGIGSSDASTSNYELSFPDDFSAIEVEDMEFYYVGEDGSSVSLNVQPKDAGFGSVTADLLREALEDALSQSYKVDVTITDNYFTTETVSGYPAYQYSLSYELDKTAITQLIIGVDADQTYTFTYTDLSGIWMEDFEKSAKGIILVTE